jgi:UDP-N-acetylmuramoylalanine--D-glutamate ligase
VITSSLWRGKRYAVLGLARSGAATVQALLASGAEVVAWDSDEAKRDALEEGEQLSFADPLTQDLTGFAAVVVSPGVPLNRHPIAGHAARYGVPVIGDIELFAQARADLPPHKVVGITGTNGKSTTTALVHHILQTAGVPTMMGGNIGLPILGQEPLPAGGVYVLELSSYQIDLTFTLDCDVAVLLNITPDHLDRYASFDAYAASKARLFDLQRSGKSRSFLFDEDEQTHKIREALRLTDRWFTELRSCDVEDPDRGFRLPPTLAGPHNKQNATAAKAVCQSLQIADEAVQAGLLSYPGLPHRMERIRDLNGVLFVNDSKATNADSTAPALAAYPAIRWILGGQAKAADLDACVPYFGHVCSAYTLGEAGGMFAALLGPHMTVEEAGTLAVAVAHAARDAAAGETVLLSPACASFDQYRNFEDRGDAFRQLVEAL